MYKIVQISLKSMHKSMRIIIYLGYGMGNRQNGGSLEQVINV